MLSELPAITIAQGHILALFAFDIGYAVDLDTARQLLPAAPVPPLSRKKQNPAYLQYATPPLITPLLAAPTFADRIGSAQLTLYDFGTASIAYRWPIQQEFPLADLPLLSVTLANASLEQHARQHVNDVLTTITSAITRPNLSPLVEDYYQFVLERLSPTILATDLIEQYGQLLAQTLRFDTQQLSQEQRLEALSQRISYYTTDVTIIDWNSAIICDPDYEDAQNILELVNVELLEARYIDGQLDRRMRDLETLRHRREEIPLPFRTPYRREIETLAELRIESALISERVDNALKLIGDLYLARVYAAAADRFALPEWDGDIARKLDIVEDLYQLLTDRVSAAQGQTLEIVVIVLILFEIVTGLLRLR